MLRRYDFQCEHGHVSEHFVESEQRTIPCPECGLEAKRLISPVPCKLSGTGGFPGEAIKWAERHEKAAQKQ